MMVDIMIIVNSIISPKVKGKPNHHHVNKDNIKLNLVLIISYTCIIKYK